MSEFILRSSSEQIEIYLRKEIYQGRWSERMPGAPKLAKELDVDHKAVVVALNQLEREGLLVGQGAGRRRKIVLPAGRKAVTKMRIAILSYNVQARQVDYMIKLQHKLTKAGHQAFFPIPSLTDLGMEVSRVRRMVKSVEVDAWVVDAGSYEVLKWFSKQPTPTFALFGRMAGLPIAGSKPGKAESFVNATRELINLGHRRISMLVPSNRRLPQPGRVEISYLEELKSHGIQTSGYNLPDWDDSTKGFYQILEALFTTTPPTALILDEAPLFIAAQQFLLSRGLRVPQDVSLICTDYDPHFSWCTPTIAHIHWDSQPVIRRIVNWASNISRGKKDIRQKLTPAEFKAGGTIGPVR